MITTSFKVKCIAFKDNRSIVETLRHSISKDILAPSSAIDFAELFG